MTRWLAREGAERPGGRGLEQRSHPLRMAQNAQAAAAIW
jgi:hypothetical protein